MNEQIKFEEVVAFAKTNAWRIVLRGVISLAVVAGLLALYYAFAPRSESYRAEVQITLETRDGKQVYPNGDAFGFHDIISAPVMNRVWTKYGFDKKGVKFEDFCEWFSIVAYDKERAKIDAEFQGKMSKRNITVAELVQLQKEYETKLASRTSSQFALTMSPNALVDRDTAVRILADIPETWFVKYSLVKAPQIPKVVSVDAISTYVERSKAFGGRALELIDMIRKYIGELRATCAFVRTGIMAGRNARIGGVDIGNYESELDLFSTEILRLKNRLLVSGTAADLGGYLAARQDDMACEKMELEERVAAVRQTLDLIAASRSGGAVPQNGATTTSDASQLTLQLDAGFFADFSALIKREANQELVQKYARQLTDLRLQKAELSARQLNYEQIEQYVKNNAGKNPSDKIATNAVVAIDGFAKPLLELGGKIVAFRDQCLQIYRTSDQFYVVAEPTAYAKSFKFTLPRFALGILALWALYNLIALVKLWNRE